MTEIRLTLTDPHLAASQLRHAANHWNDGPPKSNPVGDLLLTLADSIEEHVKPAIEEPQEFGSLVRAWSPTDPEGVAADTWQMSPAHGKHYWQSQAGKVEAWAELTLSDVEVLRIGVGSQKPLTASDLSRLGIETNARKNGPRTMRVCISDVAPCGEQDCNSCFPIEQAP